MAKPASSNAKEVFLITKNVGKLLAAESAFTLHNIVLKQLPIDYPEIQADTGAEIASFTAKQAAKNHNVPVIREDHSIIINALGIPGPYSNFMEKKVSADKLLNILAAFKDRTGYFEIAAAHAKPNGKVKTYSFRVPIRFAEEQRGSKSSGWNTLIILENETRTLAEYDEKERLSIWNKNFLKIAEDIENGI